MFQLQFFDGSLDPAIALPGTFDPPLLGVAFLTAALATLAAFAFVDPIRHRGTPAHLWRSYAAGAITLGCGAWIAHAIGVLAFRLPIPVAYEFAGTLLGLVPAVLGAGIALLTTARGTSPALPVVVGGIGIGIGIVVLHIAGVAAMRMEAVVLHSHSMFATAAGGAMVLGAAALGLWHRVLRAGRSWKRRVAKLAAAGLMASAMCAMQYWAMRTAYVFPEAANAAGNTELSPILFSVLIVALGGAVFAPAALVIWGTRIQAKLDDLALASKFPVVIVSVALLATLATGYTAYTKFSIELERFAEEKMASLRDGRKAALQIYLRSISRDLAFLAHHGQVRDALFDFTTAFGSVAGKSSGQKPASVLQRLFIQQNPHPLGRRDDFVDAGDGSDYSQIHRRYHLWFRNFQRENGYDDIFLFSPDGDLVYTVSKGRDFATNFADGIWQWTALGRAYRAVSDDPNEGKQMLFDFEPYEPKDGVPASFMTMPVFSQTGAYIGVIALQMPIGRINAITQVASGMGETGDAYLVGQDFLMRSASRFAKEAERAQLLVYTPAAQKALEGRSGVEIIDGYQGTQVLSAYTPIDFMGVRWGLLTEINVAEVLAPAGRAATFIIMATGIIVVIVALLGIILARGLAQPVAEMTGNMRRLASGDIDITVSATSRGDEIGEMARALAVFKENLIERQRAEGELRQSRRDLLDKTNMLEAVLRSMNEGLVAFDKNLKLMAWNDVYFKVRRYPERFAEVGRPFADFVRFDAERQEFGDGDVDGIVRDVVARASRSRTHNFERQRPDGTWIEVRGGPIEGGGFLSTYNDITKRKQSEQALNEAYEIISSSIQYASRIQRSILPSERQFGDIFEDFFVHWEPRDKVGGDIYWCERWGDGMLIMLGDCTGHGVPGAFMTLIAMGALERAQTEVAPGNLARLVQRLHQLMQATLNQNAHSGESDDGMDLGICYIPNSGRCLTYVGAHLSLFVVAGGEVEEVKGDRVSIGYRRIPYDQRYTEIEVPLSPGRHFYLTSDGLIDQIGGDNCRAFGKRRFKALIAGFENESFKERRDAIVGGLASHQGGHTRRDDVAVMGFKVALRARQGVQARKAASRASQTSDVRKPAIVHGD